jgi:hypothetical protein
MTKSFGMETLINSCFDGKCQQECAENFSLGIYMRALE